MTTRPRNAARYLHDSVEFRCGSDVTDRGERIPVNWKFSGEKDCIYCAGTLTNAHAGRYSVDASVIGETALRVENITVDDVGFYTCVDAAGSGPEESSAELIIIHGENLYRC